MSKREISRREFLRTLGGAAAAAAGLDAMARAGLGAKKSKVVVVFHSKALAEGHVANPEVVTAMLEAGIQRLTGKPNVRTAWATFIRPQDVVSVKFNGVGAPTIETHPEIRDWVRKWALRMGVPDANCVTWWRKDLQGEDAGWSEPYTLPSGLKTQVHNVLVRATVGINLPVCKAHWGTGITVALKNHFGSINNAGRFHDWEQNEGGPQFPPMWQSIGEIYALEPIAKKEKLIICDALRPVWDDGPGDNPRNRWNYNAILFSTDAVAVDSICCDILEAKRQEVAGKPFPATSGRKSVNHAAALGLGNAAREKIELVEIRLG